MGGRGPRSVYNLSVYRCLGGGHGDGDRGGGGGLVGGAVA